MNIIIINHYAGSDYHGMEFRPYYMAREWVKMGHDVTIIACTYSHLRKVNPKITEDFTHEMIDGIRYIWVKGNEYHGNSIGRFRNMVTFSKKLEIHSKKLAKELKPDAVIASSTYTFDIYAAHKIAKHANGRLYFEIHDLWPLTPMLLGGLTPYNPYIMYLQKGEDHAFRHSNKIISILPNADKHVKERGFNTPYVNIPNGIFVPSSDEVPESNEEQIAQLKELKKQGYFLVAYTGNHSPANDLGSFIDGALYLKEKEKIRFVLVGKGNVKDELIKHAKDIGADNVMFMDPVDKTSMAALLDTIDVAFMGLKREKLFQYGVSPNKLFDYMLAAKPIIYSVEASNDPVSDADAGITIPASNPEKIAEAVRTLYEMPKERLAQMGANAKAYVIKNHKYETLAERFIEALKD